MKRKQHKFEWLRGYRCHTLWESHDRVGRIEVCQSETGLVYRCAAGTVQKEERRLPDAKRWVARHAACSKGQLDLFQSS